MPEILILIVIGIIWLFAKASDGVSGVGSTVKKKLQFNEERDKKYKERNIDLSKSLFDRNIDIIKNFERKITSSGNSYSFRSYRDHYIENETRDCINEICLAENRNDIRPLSKYLSTWITSAPREWAELAKQIEKVFNDRKTELVNVEARINVIARSLRDLRSEKKNPSVIRNIEKTDSYEVISIEDLQEIITPDAITWSEIEKDLMSYDGTYKKFPNLEVKFEYVPVDKLNRDIDIYNEELEKDVNAHTKNKIYFKELFDGYKNKWYTKEIFNKVKLIRIKTYMSANCGVIKRTLDFISFALSSFFCGLFQPKPDVIIGVTPQFFCALSACLLSIKKKSAFVMIVCDLWPDAVVASGLINKNWIYKLLKKIEYWMYQQANSIIILSENYRSYLNNLGIPDKKIVTSISGASKQFYPRKKNSILLDEYNLSDKFVIGYIGTFGIFYNYQNIFALAKSFKKNAHSHILENTRQVQAGQHGRRCPGYSSHAAVQGLRSKGRGRRLWPKRPDQESGS